MVARVDTVLREELEIEDGLADPRVYVLDPCCGTGAYLVEVLKRIAANLEEKGEDALGSYEVKNAAEQRVLGFELLPAPFVVAHLQLGLLLQNLGVPLSEDKNERAGIYLTNSLTNLDLPGPTKEKVTQLRLDIPELEEERDAAEHIKQQVPILVILGNPPYNAFAGISPDEEQGLVKPYKDGLISEWGIKKFNLDDLYVRFFRLAEHRIAEKTGKGIVCYISNFSYLSDPSFVVMRQRFLSEFDTLWFDSLNGDSRETGKLTPDGKPDPSVFSTEYNREGIRLGTAIGLMVRKVERSQEPTVYYRQFWGVTKRADLLKSLETEDFDAQYELANPDKTNRFSFRPSEVSTHYLKWPRVVDLCDEAPISGLQEMRKGALIDIDSGSLKNRMQLYFDSSTDWVTLTSLRTGLTENGGDFDAKSARPKIQALEKFNEKQIVRYALYHFDLRWCYYSVIGSLWNRPRPSLVAQCWRGNSYFVTRMIAERPNEHVPFIVTSAIPDYHLLRPNAIAIPIRLRITSDREDNAHIEQNPLITASKTSKVEIKANLSQGVRAYLNNLGITNPDSDSEAAALTWMHALAIGYSSNYLKENADGIKQDWPRIPLPDSKESLLLSADLGRTLAALLDSESAVPGVTSGKVRSELRSIAVISRVGGGALNPDAGDLSVTAGWGHGSNGSATMPGKGRMIAREYTSQELRAISEGAEALGLLSEQALEHLGTTTCDIYLNNTAYWKNIPGKVWSYTIGGYQVIKKWLSYREQQLLGRSLTTDEVREVTGIARRIASILLLEPALDENYQHSKLAAYAWQMAGAES